MDNETKKIFEEQLTKMPQAIIEFLSSSSWNTDLDEIASLYNLSEEEMLAFKREVVFILSGLIHPDALTEAIETEVGIKGAVLEALVANVEKKIFTPIRTELEEFFEEEASKNSTENEKQETKPSESEPTEERAPEATVNTEEKGEAMGTTKEESLAPKTIARTWEKTPETKPDNLPTEETTESFLPNLMPKTINPINSAPTTLTPQTKEVPEGNSHPFEETMKKTFTAGKQSMGELSIEHAPTTQQQSSSMNKIDPYREPIE